MIVIANVFSKLRDCQRLRLDNSLKSVVSEHPLTVNMLKDPKHLWNLYDSNFILFFHQSEKN